MDPNETLRRLRAAVYAIQTPGYSAVTREDMAELFDALDEWLLRGGFLPDAWQPFAGSVGRHDLNKREWER